jgi:glyoxylase-like metal-dependent hydrolase (beta-lactamase superfamily II)
MLNIEKFVFSPFAENTYVVWDEKSLEGIIIDPGCVDNDEEEKLSGFISKNKIQVKKLINTHCHIDHVFGNAFVKEKYNCKYLVPEKDLELLNHMKEQADAFGVSINPSPQPDNFITEESELKIGDETGKYIFTPGHTPGEYCIYFEESNFCISGDVLFKEGIGRTDLWGGNFKTLIYSIRNQLFLLPDETVIYPGHGEKSTIGYEKKYNPFLQ